MSFIKIIDSKGFKHILNKNSIIHIKEYLGGYIDSKSVIEFGNGFIDVIFIKETVDEIGKKYGLIYSNNSTGPR